MIKNYQNRIFLLNNDDTINRLLDCQITSGSITVNGDSTIRRTCQLTIVINKENFDALFKNLMYQRIRIDTGVATNNQDYEWYSQGIFIITSCQLSQNINSITLTIAGSDKMCLLDGTIGGTIPSKGTFSSIEEVDANEQVTTKELLMKDIVRNLVVQFGNEQNSKINVDEIPTAAKAIIAFNGDISTPLYIKHVSGKEGYRTIIDGDTVITDEKKAKELNYSNNVYRLDTDCSIYRFTKGNTCGFMQTEATYPGTLTCNMGDTVVSLLNKIIEKLSGEFEFFYDVAGMFRFQQKRNLMNQLNELQITDQSNNYLSRTYSYLLTNDDPIISLSYNPDIKNIKNDFAIWGKLSDGTAIELRYAIQSKPKTYQSPYGEKIKYSSSPTCSWREIIYQMALDYYAHHNDIDFESKIASANTAYSTGKTGYEQYYMDVMRFYPELNSTNPKNNVNLIGWIDFLEPTYPFDKYSVDKIGDHLITINQDNISNIYINTECESNEFISYKDVDLQDPPKDKIIMGKLVERSMVITSLYQSCYDVALSLLQTNVLAKETVQITTLPIYDLEPNRILKLQLNREDIDDNYLIKQFTIPLAYNGTMSITLNRHQDIQINNLDISD